MIYHILGATMTILFIFLGYKTYKAKKLNGILKWIIIFFCFGVALEDLQIAISGKLPEDDSASETTSSDDKTFKKNAKERHYKDLTEGVDKLSNKYKEITSATIDENAGTLVITLSDDVLDNTGAQLQNIVKKAWTVGYNLVERNKPYPNKKNIVGIKVEDSAGNKLGHSNVLGNFKYDTPK